MPPVLDFAFQLLNYQLSSDDPMHRRPDDPIAPTTKVSIDRSDFVEDNI
jgi:hypothetical protein